MSQWANYRSVPSSNGWSALGGQTTVAYYPNGDPCGSSGGSGVAASIGLAFAAIGTETDGSIVCPSDKNNIVGIKPTVGLTSRYNVIPISEHQDTVGPMAGTVKDAAYLLQTIVGKDSKDNYTSAIPHGSKFPDYVAACKKDALRGVRIGVPRNVISNLGSERWGESQEALTRGFNAGLDMLKKAGATIVDSANFTNILDVLESEWQEEILIADFQVNLRQYLARLAYNPNNITDLVSLRTYTHNDPREMYPDINTVAWDATLAQGWDNTSPDFWKTYSTAIDYANNHGLVGTIRREKLDVMVMPTIWAPNWASTVGTPIVSVPLGFYPTNVPEESSDAGDLTEIAPGVPYGISFLGEKWSEEKLIGYAYAFEQITNTRSTGKPYLQPRTELADILGKNIKL
jgi:amidase